MATPPPRPPPPRRSGHLQAKPGAKGYLIVAGFVGAVLTALYPIFVYPYLHIDQYKEAQQLNRKSPIDATQPGNMRVWSDPFEPREEK